LRHRPGGVGVRSERPGVTGAMGSLMSWDPWPRPVARATVETQECTQIGENDLSDPFLVICVHCCAVVDRRGDSGVYTDRRKRTLGAVLGHLCTLLRCELRRVARAPQPPWCAGSAPSVARLSLGRENRLCASGAAARLAFSLRRQPTQTPEEPAFCTVSFLLLRGFTLLSVRELRKDDRGGPTAGTTGIASGFLTRINEGHSPKEAPL